jgi:hypothetical protein
MNRAAYRTLLAAAVSLALPGLAHAAKFSWFDEQPAQRDSLGRLKIPTAMFERDKRLTFGVDAYSSLASDESGGDISDAVTVYGEFGSNDGDNFAHLAALNRGVESLALSDSPDRMTGFGVKWRHRLDAVNTVSVAAGYSELPLTTSTQGRDIFDTRASLSWSGTFDGSLRPGVTGSVFFGDESARDDVYEKLGRRYYGFSIGGQLQLAEEHTPYFSYRLERHLNNGVDLLYMPLPYEQRSQVAAGWIWQVQPNWSFHAEASYGLNGATLDPYTPDRSRIFFGTRFDFR